MKTLEIFKREHQRVGYDENDLELVEYKEVHAEYNGNGQLVREERYDTDGKLNTLSINRYSEDGKLLQNESYDSEHILLQKSVYTYDGNRIVQQGNFFGDEEIEYVTRFVYDENGNLIRHEMYDGDELDYVEKEMTYENGRLIQEIENDDYGNALYINRYQYNEQGRVSQNIYEEVQNKDRRTRDYYYDEQGNCVKELVYDFKESLIAKIYRTFNADNQLVEVIEEDLDNYRKITLEYDGALCFKNTIFNKEGNIQGWAEYTYDENGKESAAMEFIPDEVQPENFRLLRETRYERS